MADENRSSCAGAQRVFLSFVASFSYKCHSRWWIIGSKTVPQSVLDAIKLGMWDYEPEEYDSTGYASTQALPGTDEKLAVLSERVSRGLPLWHPKDRHSYDERVHD
jgi:hypothetical protein